MSPDMASYSLDDEIELINKLSNIKENINLEPIKEAPNPLFEAVKSRRKEYDTIEHQAESSFVKEQSIAAPSIKVETMPAPSKVETIAEPSNVTDTVEDSNPL
jgi:hypothetical protein